MTENNKLTNKAVRFLLWTFDISIVVFGLVLSYVGADKVDELTTPVGVALGVIALAVITPFIVFWQYKGLKEALAYLVVCVGVVAFLVFASVIVALFMLASRQVREKHIAEGAIISVLIATCCVVMYSLLAKLENVHDELSPVKDTE